MASLPALKQGHVRIHLLLSDPASITPGGLLQASGLEPEQVDNIHIDRGEALIDVIAEVGRDARTRLEQLGPTQIRHPERPAPAPFVWLRINVGRNHGLTARQLDKVLNRADAGKVGQINIKNTYALVGLPEDRIAAIAERLEGTRLNGVILHPTHKG
ncbi:MAG: DbpA RNA binding domain-containing protein [Planctomycetota bacterium]